MWMKQFACNIQKGPTRQGIMLIYPTHTVAETPPLKGQELLRRFGVPLGSWPPFGHVMRMPIFHVCGGPQVAMVAVQVEPPRKSWSSRVICCGMEQICIFCQSAHPQLHVRKPSNFVWNLKLAMVTAHMLLDPPWFWIPSDSTARNSSAFFTLRRMSPCT